MRSPGVLARYLASTCVGASILVSACSNPVRDDRLPTSPAILQGNGGAQVFVRWSPDGKELAAISQFGPVILYDASTFKLARTFSIGMRMITYSHDGALIATAEGTDGARVWDASNPGTPVSIPPRDSPGSPYRGLDHVCVLDRPRAVLLEPNRERKERVFWADFSTDGLHLLTAQATGQVKVWDTQSWRLEQDFAVTTSEVRVARFLPGSSRILAGDTGGKLYLWSLEAHPVVKTLNSPISEPNSVTGIAFSPDGGTLITSHEKASGPAVVIWGTAVWSAQEKAGFGSAAFSPDGKWIALGGSHLELVNALDVESVRRIELSQITLGEVFENKSDPELGDRMNEKVPLVIESLSFSPDGTVLAAGCVDGTIRLVKVPK